MRPPIQPESLNCPNCGGSVMSDRSQCEFCRSRLKTVGCASCLGLMFLGSKFCTHCGAKALAAVVIEDGDAGDCPRCEKPLELLQMDGVSIRECGRCGGFWSDVETFESICADQEQQEAVLGFIGSDAHPHAHPAAISYVPCPDCGELMNRSNFARSSGVIVDICKQHGVWFDADELPKIIAFINRGGLAKQREKEKIALQDERSRLRDEQRKMAMIERRAGLPTGESPTSGTGIGRFVKFLFDL